MEGRSRVMIVDALQDDAEPGSVSVLEEARLELDERQEHAHHLSAWQSMKLLKMIMPVRFTLLGISISSATIETRLSTVVDGRMAMILDRVLQELIWNSSK
jgi:hydrogenase maturation protease